MIRRLFAAATLLVATATHAAEGKPFYGYAYDLDTGKYLYTEVHEPVFEGGRELSSTIRYYAPDGSLIGEKPLDYRADPYVPLFRLTLPKEGYVEAITGNGATVEMLKIDGKGKPEKRKSIRKEGLMAADSGFHHLLQAKLASIIAGQPLSFRFTVAGQLDSYRFRASKVGDSSFEGKPAVKLLVQADSLLRYLAPDLQLLYDPSTLKLLEYRGVSNMHDPATGKAYMARIVYYSAPPPDAPKNLPPLP